MRGAAKAEAPGLTGMVEFLSFFGVIALWIGLSYSLWWLYQRKTGTRQQREIALAREAAARVAAAREVFASVRRPNGELAENDLVLQTHALLKRIQEHGAFFDDVNALKAQIRRALRLPDCAPLAELLHIRRDLWAASEIVLIEDFRKLSPEFADKAAYEGLRGEAVQVLFAQGEHGADDLIELRLSLAREEAEQFAADVEEAIRLAREHERLPTKAEMIAYPIAAARALPGQIRSARDQAAAFYGQVRAAAIAIRQSETMVRGLAELRRARAELPQRVTAGMERTSAAARQSAAALKGHYEFLVTAYDVQAKYEELVRKAPELTERGRQFIARVELAEKSERLKLTSATLRDASIRYSVRGLAHLIAGLQRLQSVLEARLAAASAKAAAPQEKRGTVAGEAAAPGKEAAPVEVTAKAAQQAAIEHAQQTAPAASASRGGKRKRLSTVTAADGETAPKPLTLVERTSAAPSIAPAPLLLKPKRAQKGAKTLVGAPASPPTEAASAASVGQQDRDAATPKRVKASLASRLSDARVLGADDEEDALERPETALAQPEAEPDTEPEKDDDDPGPLTQSILQSRTREDEKPGRAQFRAFPWLRR